jgi:hypothetical protein
MLLEYLNFLVRLAGNKGLFCHRIGVGQASSRPGWEHFVGMSRPNPESLIAG